MYISILGAPCAVTQMRSNLLRHCGVGSDGFFCSKSCTGLSLRDRLLKAAPDLESDFLFSVLSGSPKPADGRGSVQQLPPPLRSSGCALAGYDDECNSGRDGGQVQHFFSTHSRLSTRPADWNPTRLQSFAMFFLWWKLEEHNKSFASGPAKNIDDL